jgi:hypothetical protein
MFIASVLSILVDYTETEEGSERELLLRTLSKKITVATSFGIRRLQIEESYVLYGWS